MAINCSGWWTCSEYWLQDDGGKEHCWASQQWHPALWTISRDGELGELAGDFDGLFVAGDVASVSGFSHDIGYTMSQSSGLPQVNLAGGVGGR